MDTKILHVDSKDPQKHRLEEASNIIKEGGLVAFPTETVYGLGANGLNATAVKKIFLAKGRPQDNPLILHVSDMEQVGLLVKEIPERAKKLMDQFWPGPLTLVFKKSALVPDEVTCGLDSVAIRMPRSTIALKLISLAECPLAAPSANLSGKPSPTDAEHVIDDLDGKIDAVIDGGPVEIGIESTVLDVTGEAPQILRPGRITKEDLEPLLGEVGLKVHSQTPTAPGMKYAHYAPSARVVIVDSEEDIAFWKGEHSRKRIKLLHYADEEDMARNLFKDFRDCDKKKYDIILVQPVKEERFGSAIMNRLRKASSNK